MKNGVTVLNAPGTIDSDYRGEIKVILINLGNNNFDIRSDRVGGWLRITDTSTYAYVSRTDLRVGPGQVTTCLLYTSAAADE